MRGTDFGDVAVGFFEKRVREAAANGVVEILAREALVHGAANPTDGPCNLLGYTDFRSNLGRAYFALTRIFGEAGLVGAVIQGVLDHGRKQSDGFGLFTWHERSLNLATKQLTRQPFADRSGDLGDLRFNLRHPALLIGLVDGRNVDFAPTERLDVRDRTDNIRGDAGLSRLVLKGILDDGRK